MNYKLLLGDVKEVSKDTLKRIIFELDQTNMQKIKELNVDDETRYEIVKLFKDNIFFNMLLVNALK